MHEGERRGRGKGVAARVGAAEIAAMGKGSAQEGRPPAHRNGFSSRSGVPHGLFSVKSTSCSSLQNAHASGSLRSPYGCLRTEMPLRDIPVLRMAYFTIKPHRGLISKTHMLQVRCAHPTGNFAPKCPFGTFRCSGRLILRKEYTVLFAPKRSTSRFAALTLRVTSHRNAPSGHSGVPVGLFYAKSTQYSLLQNARPSGSLRSPCGGLRTATSLQNVPVLRMTYLNKRATCALLFKTHMLQVRCAHPTPSHRNAPSGHSGVPVGLFYAKSTQYSLLQNARPSGSLRSPCGGLRTATSLQNVPVLRMTYLNKRATCALLFKTHMLQVRCAHPTPSHRNAPSGHSGVPVGLFYAKSTQYSLLQNARPSGSLRSPCGGLRTATSLQNVPVLRMTYLNKRATCALLFKTHMLQVRCAHPTPSHRNAPSGHSGVPVGLFYAKSTQYSLLQNARPSGLLRSPYGYRGVEDPAPPFTAGAGTSEKEMRQKTEGRSAEKLLK